MPSGCVDDPAGAGTRVLGVLRALEQLLVAATGLQVEQGARAVRLLGGRLEVGRAEIAVRVDGERRRLDDGDLHAFERILGAGGVAEADLPVADGPRGRGRLGVERGGQKIHLLHAGRRRDVGGVDDAVLGGVGARHSSGCGGGKREDCPHRCRDGHCGHHAVSHDEFLPFRSLG